MSVMGVRNPTTLVHGVECGIDMFDCVLPTRTARMGCAFSREGRLKLSPGICLSETVMVSIKETAAKSVVNGW